MKFEVFSIFRYDRGHLCNCRCEFVSFQSFACRDIPISGQNYLKFRESEAEDELHVFSEAEENLDFSEHADVAIVKVIHFLVSCRSQQV